MITRGDKINLVIGWSLIPIAVIVDEPVLFMVACGIFIGGLIKYIFDK